MLGSKETEQTLEVIITCSLLSLKYIQNMNSLAWIKENINVSTESIILKML